MHVRILDLWSGGTMKWSSLMALKHSRIFVGIFLVSFCCSALAREHKGFRSQSCTVTILKAGSVSRGGNVRHPPLINWRILPELHEMYVGLAKGLIFTVLITPVLNCCKLNVESREECQAECSTLWYFFQKKNWPTLIGCRYL